MRLTKARVTVLEGQRLLAMDRSGTSDPYVKVMQVRLVIGVFHETHRPVDVSIKPQRRRKRSPQAGTTSSV